MKSAAYNWLISLGACGPLLWFAIFHRRVINIIGAPSPKKKFPVMEYRSRYPELVRLHRELLLNSARPIAWRVLGLASGALIAVGITLVPSGRPSHSKTCGSRGLRDRWPVAPGPLQEAC
jgi:hypothetical protein